MTVSMHALSVATAALSALTGIYALAVAMLAGMNGFEKDRIKHMRMAAFYIVLSCVLLAASFF